jgi:hypothetical protein
LFRRLAVGIVTGYGVWNAGRARHFVNLTLCGLNLRGLCAVSNDDDNNDDQFPFINVVLLVKEKLLGSGK